MQKFQKIVWTLALLAVVVSARGDEVKPEIIESLDVGPVTYTNVQVLNRTRSDLFVKHAGGVVSVKVRDLDRSTQLQLGYHLADPSPTNDVNSRSAFPEFEIDPRFRELAEQIVWETHEYLREADPRIPYAAGGVALLLYLFFCYCCRLICRKAGQGKVALVWLPLLKQVPLLRAAGMKPWWILANLLPPVFAIVFIVWSFKIARARGKTPLTGCLLLLPVINIFAFLYLAFADRLSGDDDDAGNGRVLSYQQSPRRAA